MGALVMGNIIGRILLVIIYYVVCTMLALIMKVLQRDRLSSKKKEVASYWKKYEQPFPDKALYEQLF